MENNSAFISYRRNASAFMARAVFQDLKAHDIDVFMDVESIDSGQFESVILNQIAARPYFLLILTPGTLDRCNEPDDWLRREIDHAINLHRVIIPLTTPNFSFEQSGALLTDNLAKLPQYNALDVPHNYFDEAMERLRKRYLKPIALSSTPTSDEDKVIVQRKLANAEAEPSVTEPELDAQHYFEHGLARSPNDTRGKILDYSAAIRINPQFGDAFYNRGLAHLINSDPSNAYEDFSRAIILNPQDAQAYSARGFIRVLRYDAQGALEDCNEALQLDPSDSQAYLGRAIARALMAQLDETVKDINQAITLEPQLGEVLDRIDFNSDLNDPLVGGDLYVGLEYVRRAFNRGYGDIDGALADINAAIHVHPPIGQILAQAKNVRNTKHKVE